MTKKIDGLIDEVADAAVSTAIAIDTGEVTLEDGQAHLKKMIDSGKHQVHTLIEEAEREARNEIFDLYGTPQCEHLHHPKKWQHSLSEDCPVLERLTELKSKDIKPPKTLLEESEDKNRSKTSKETR